MSHFIPGLQIWIVPINIKYTRNGISYFRPLFYARINVSNRAVIFLDSKEVLRYLKDNIVSTVRTIGNFRAGLLFSINNLVRAHLIWKESTRCRRLHLPQKITARRLPFPFPSSPCHWVKSPLVELYSKNKIQCEYKHYCKVSRLLYIYLYYFDFLQSIGCARTMGTFNVYLLRH